MLVNDNNYGICRIFINLMKTLTLDFAMILFLHPYNIFSLNDIKAKFEAKLTTHLRTKF